MTLDLQTFCLCRAGDYRTDHALSATVARHGHLVWPAYQRQALRGVANSLRARFEPLEDDGSKAEAPTGD